MVFEMTTCSLNGTPVLQTTTVSFAADALMAAWMVVNVAAHPGMTPALLTALSCPPSGCRDRQQDKSLNHILFRIHSFLPFD